jgi:CHAD domain-containing protein
MIRRFTSYRLFGKRVLKQRFGILLTEITAVRTKNDADSIHDMRVASRRFHAAAQVFPVSLSPALLAECERYVRRLRKSAGAMRDSDVQRFFLERLLKKSTPHGVRPGLQRLIIRLHQRRKKEYADVIEAIAEFDRRRIAEKMKRALSLPLRSRRAVLTLRQRAAREIISHLLTFLSFEQYVHQSSALDELHQMRIAAKRLRYMMEIFNPVYRSGLKPFIKIVRSIQDALGEMHDCSVWLASLPAFLEKERKRTEKFFGDSSSFHLIEKGILFFADAARREQARQYKSFVRIWKITEQTQTWGKLKKLMMK